MGDHGQRVALAPSRVSSLSAGATRLIIGAATLIGIAIATGTTTMGSLLSHRGVYGAALAMAAYQPVFFTGVDQTA